MSLILDPHEEAAVNGTAPPHAKRHHAPASLPSRAAERADFWSAAASKRLRKGGLDADAVWNLYWSKRRAVPSLAKLLDSKGTPLVWGWNNESSSEELQSLLQIADKLARGAKPRKLAHGRSRVRLEEAIAHWLEAAQDGDTNADFAIGCLAAAHILNHIGLELEAVQGWALLDFLVQTAIEAAPWTVDVDGPADAALAQQLVAGELPLTLAYFFADMAPLAALHRQGLKRLSQGQAELLGDEALVHAAYLGVLYPLVASWTRARAIGASAPNRRRSHAAHKHFNAAVRQAIRWTDGSGRALLVDNEAPTWTRDFLAAALRTGGCRADAAAARALSGHKSRGKKSAHGKRKLPSASTLSESAGLALLRSQWSPRATTIAIDFSTPDMRLDVAADGQPLFAGIWSASSTIDGQRLQPAGDWENVCWFSDADVDYIEFRLDLDRGARLERQVLLAHDDGFVFLADHLQDTSTALLEHAWKLRLAPNLLWRPEEETRDVALGRVRADRGDDEHDTHKNFGRLIPLALPEWRIDPRIGELTMVDQSVRLAQRADARAVACPLFIDLNARRVAKPSTWRQLAVAEALQLQPADVAVGYRVQCGPQQWLFYRSQAERGNRTMLGQNTSSEFFAARFLAPSGQIEELVEVQG